MKLSAIDALQRGLLALRANPMLVVWQLVQAIVVSAIAVAGMAPLVLALGAGAARILWEASREWSPARSSELERMAAEALEQWPLFVAALAAGFAVWTVAFLVYCWIQAGVLGRLAAGNERAAGAARPAVDTLRVYSWASFSRDAAAGVWKFFWLINLIGLVGLVALLLAVVCLSLVLALGGGDGGLALALTVGCLLMLVSFAFFLFLYAWTGVAKAELAVRKRGVLDAFRRSLRLLFRRLGAVLLLVVLFIAASIALGIVFVPVSLFLDFAMGDSIARQIAADVGLTLVQMPFTAVFTVALSAALIALARSEQPDPAAPSRAPATALSPASGEEE